MSRLAPFLRLLTIREDQANARVVEAANKARVAAGELAARQAAHLGRPVPRGHLTAAQILALRLQGMGSLEQIEAAQAELERRQEDESDANEARSVAAVRRKSVERVTQRRRDEAAQVAQAAARRSLDELAMLRKVAQ